MKPPKGFTVSKDQSTVQIYYRSTGMGCMIFFIGFISITLGTLFTTALLFDTPNGFFGEGSAIYRSERLIVATLSFLYFAVTYAIFSILWKIFGISEFCLSEDTLFIRRKLFFLSQGRNIPAKDIQSIRQIKDGGTGEDSFPSWGLNIHAPHKIKILSKERREKSDWLGVTLANFYQVDFYPAIDQE